MDTQSLTCIDVEVLFQKEYCMESGGNSMVLYNSAFTHIQSY